MNQAGIASAKTYLNADGELDLTLNSGQSNIGKLYYIMPAQEPSFA